jgi:hypothetical protein
VERNQHSIELAEYQVVRMCFAMETLYKVYAFERAKDF